MKKFNVVIEETLCQTFEVQADNAEEAKKIAEKKYRNSEFIVDSGEVQDLKFLCFDETN